MVLFLSNLKKKIVLAVEFSKTSSYYWPLIGDRKYNYAVYADGQISADTEETTGPFGFGEAVKLSGDTVSKSLYGKEIFQRPGLKLIQVPYCMPFSFKSSNN